MIQRKNAIETVTLWPARACNLKQCRNEKLMRGFLLLSLALTLSLCVVETGHAQRMLRFEPKEPVVCYYHLENRADHVPVSDNFARLRARGAAGRKKTALFEVEYINFPADNKAKNAFQYAVEIWESELDSSVPIRIRAEWSALDAGVLGQALWGSAYANFGGEQHMNTFYPVALAEKIARRDINGADEPDIVASFSSRAAWYLGTDGNTPSGKMDLVTIVLHEIGHGLGFTHTYDVDGTQGAVGLPSGDVSIPFIFDLFVEDALTKNLVYDYESPSAEMATALQSTNVFFNSPLSLAALGGKRPELYAPKTFNSGSSISHLDESVFDSDGDPNRLMSPQISFAESIHDPSGVLTGVLADLGWIYTNIDHVPLNDTEKKDGQPFVVKASIRSDNGYDAGQVKLHYTSDGTNYTTLNMTSTGIPNEFQASIPGVTTDWAYAYYISVIDAVDRVFTSPGKLEAPGAQPEQGTHFFNIGPDLASPEIIHDPVQYAFEGDADVELIVEVTDNLGVEEVIVEYIVNEGDLQTTVMDEVPGTDQFTATLTFAPLNIGDEIQYRIIARDLAAAENTKVLPDGGYFTITATGIMPVQDSYSNDFNEPSNDFFGTSFQITTPDGFDNGAIHTEHPYSNGTGVNHESNYIYQLQVPIRIGELNPVIKFDEIVLVEPGETGSSFGDDDFFDYVVVEGSVDRGLTWKPFAPGYDSRARDPWLTRYNQKMTDTDSESTGDPTLYLERTINMLENENFKPGDEVLVRFRLFADQYAHGWGWAIDNLAIQAPVTDLEETLETAFKVYPVPVRDDLVFELLASPGSLVRIQICDLQGRILFTESIASATGGVLKRTIDTGNLQEGMYILQLHSQDQHYTRKFLKLSR